MNFALGLCGAHRTGKTTTARAMAEQTGIDYLSISASNVLADMGLEPKDITSLDLRIEVQQRLVKACEKTFMGRRKPFVSDRTPIDVAAYMLADAGQDVTMEQAWAIKNIVTDCIDITNCCFSSLVLFCPGIPYVAEPGKPLPNSAYQEHIHTLVTGLLSDHDMKVRWLYFARHHTVLEKRVSTLKALYDGVLEDAGYEAENYMLS